MIVCSRPGPVVVTLTVALGVVLATGVVAAFDPEAIDVSARGLPRLHSLIVSQRGEVIFERYYNRATAARPANVKSASKSVIAALVGIAIDRELIAGVRDADRHLVPGAGQGPRSAQARHHRRGPAGDALGARGNQRPRVRGLGDAAATGCASP